MDKVFALKIRKIFGWITVGLTVFLGALFLGNVLDIYFTGKAKGVGAVVYSREIASQHLATILPFFIFYVVWVIAVLVIYTKFKVDTKPSVYSEPVYIFKRYQKRLISANALFEGDREPLFAQYNSVLDKIKKLKIITLAVWAVAIIAFLVYMFLPSSFTDKNHATEEVLRMAYIVLPIFMVAFAVNIVCNYVISNLCNGFLPSFKDLTKGLKPVNTSRFYDNKKFILILRIVIIFIGALFIILGIALKDNDGKNGVFYVLQKAINICTECIGLG